MNDSHAPGAYEGTGGVVHYGMRGLSIPVLGCVLGLLAGCAQLDAFIDDLSDLSGTGHATTPGQGASPGHRPLVRTSRDHAPPPLFGDWWTLTHPDMKKMRRPSSGDPCNAVPAFAYNDVNTYVPVNIPGAGHGGPSFVSGEWYDWFARCYTAKIAASGAPVAVLIRERNCPFPYATKGVETSPGQVASMLDAVPRLDYLLMDLEPISGGTDRDVIRNAEEIVRLVRSHPNPDVANAYIGNYNDWPGKTDEAQIWPKKRSRTRVGGRWDRDRFYRDNFNVAMPIAYPYEAYSRHSDSIIQKGPSTPNDRAAAFWAPIERVSAAARDLPPDHLLIPWVSSFIEYDEGEAVNNVYNAPPPSREDLEAIIRHLRLRGAYSFMVWTADRDQTDHPTINYTAYKSLAINAWASLDPAFPAGESPQPMNLSTDKASGVTWSGVVAGGRAWVLVSNLGPRAASVTLPDIPGVPRQTPEVPPGKHRLFRWPVGG